MGFCGVELAACLVAGQFFEEAAWLAIVVSLSMVESGIAVEQENGFLSAGYADIEESSFLSQFFFFFAAVGMWEQSIFDTGNHHVRELESLGAM